MSAITHPTCGSPRFNARQKLFLQRAPVSLRGSSDAAGASAATAVGAQPKPMGFFKRLIQSFKRREMERQEAYLGESTDFSDLEQRMKKLEYLRSFNANQWGSHSPY